MINVSDSNEITRKYLDSMLVETRYINSDLPTTEVTLFGKSFDTPIMTAALSHLYDVCPDGMTEFARGAKKANAVCFVGMGVFKALALGADGVCVGRNLMGALKGGSDAMAARINELTGELKSIMARSGAHNVKDIDPEVIHIL